MVASEDTIFIVCSVQPTGGNEVKASGGGADGGKPPSGGSSNLGRSSDTSVAVQGSLWRVREAPENSEINLNEDRCMILELYYRIIGNYWYTSTILLYVCCVGVQIQSHRIFRSADVCSDRSRQFRTNLDTSSLYESTWRKPG